MLGIGEFDTIIRLGRPRRAIVVFNDSQTEAIGVFSHNVERGRCRAAVEHENLDAIVAFRSEGAQRYVDRLFPAARRHDDAEPRRWCRTVMGYGLTGRPHV